MPDLAKLRPHTAAVVDALDGALKTFDAGAPDLNETAGGQGWGWQGTPGQSKFKPYYIVYPLPGGIFDGPLGCPDDDASLILQVTCVGATRAQCEAAADKANELLMGQALAVADRFISRVWCDFVGGTTRDDSVQPPVFISTPRYRIESTPAD